MTTNNCSNNGSSSIPQSPTEGSWVEPTSVHGENNLSQYYAWARRKFGAPTVRVELTDDQIYDAFQEALVKYTAMAERPEKYYTFVTCAGVNTYPMPSDFMSMCGEQFYYIPNSMINFIETFTGYQMYVSFTGNLDVTQYETVLEGLQMKVSRLGASPAYEILWNPPRIKLFPAPTGCNRVVFAYIAMPRFEDWGPQQDPMGWNWVRNYAIALMKEQLGRIRGRYGTAIVLGDGSINQDSAELLSEAREDKTKLEEQLEQFRRPCPIMIL